MLALLRILFGFALISVLGKAVQVAGPNPQTEGTTDAGYVAVAVGIGILNAIVWAPFLGRLLADPLTGAFTSGNAADFTNNLLQFAHKLALRRWRRSALFFAFLEGVRHPDRPGAFVLGLNHARSGSWLEKVFAREVWKFDNAENCLRAWKILQTHGVGPDLHRRPEVNLLIQAQQRVVPPPPLPLEVPPAPAPPPPGRNERIRLFEGAAPTSPATAPVEAVVPPPPTDVAPEPTAPEREAEPQVGTETAAEAPAPTAPAADPKPPLSLAERLRVLFTGRTRD